MGSGLTSPDPASAEVPMSDWSDGRSPVMDGRRVSASICGGMESSPLDGLAAAQGHWLRELLALAGEEARRLGHHYVGTGHVAVAAIQMSADEGSVVDARSRLESLLGRGSAQADDPLQATPRLIQLVSECRAASETDDADASHVLSAIRRLEPAVAQTVLAE